MKLLFATLLAGFGIATITASAVEAHPGTVTWSIKKAEYAVGRDTDAIAKCYPVGIPAPTLMQRLATYRHFVCTITDGTEKARGTVHVIGNWTFIVTNVVYIPGG